MRLAIDVTLAYAIDGDADVLLLIEAAAMADQRLEQQDLRIFCDGSISAQPGLDGIGQRTWVQSSDHFRAEYRAIVAIDRPTRDLAALPATAPRDVPAEAVPYLLPSRYCESDRFEGFVHRDFPGLSGGRLAAALRDWVRDNIDYAANSSTGETTALATFASRSGVCRDYAHLLVALARAGGIPARCVSAYAPGVDPPDFHAVAELWLGGTWQLVDATGMAAASEIVRVAVGRDATDIAFMTVFGTAQLLEQRVTVVRLDD
jgi:transglutaminase-like putative cysteine protease